MGASVKDWSELGFSEIYDNRTNKINFAVDFRKVYGEKLNVGCRKCIREAYKRIINDKSNKFKTMGKVFKLKKKYEGVFYKGKPIRNGDLSNKVANDLLKNHKAGADLFETIGEAEEKEPTKIKDATIKVLKATYSDLKATKKKDILIELTEAGIDVNGLIGGEIPPTDDE